jgi:hypothetical protein
LRPDVWLTFLLALGLIGFFVLAQIQGVYPQYPYRATGALVEGLLLLLALWWNGYLYYWELKLTQTEMKQRLQLILDKLKSPGMTYKHVIYICCSNEIWKWRVAEKLI